MKKIIVLITCFLLIAMQFTLHAQRKNDDPERWEKFRAEKVAYLTTALDLTPAEAQKFWPVYNQMEKERMEAQKRRRDVEHKVRDAEETISDNEIIRLTREYAETKEKEGNLNASYNEKFLKILPPKKVLKLYKAENEFRMDMIKKWRSERKRDDNK
jgi:hypothetical protein